MLTYSFDDREGESLYGHLYRCIRRDIESGVIAAGAKLPSKRAFAKHLGVSLITVEGAYQQLVAEGYVRAEPRKGYFANALELPPAMRRESAGRITQSAEPFVRDALAGMRVGGQAPASTVGTEVVDAAPASMRAVVPTDGEASASATESTFGALHFNMPTPEGSRPLVADLAAGSVATDLFPCSLWAKTLRDVLAHEPERTLLGETPAAGSLRLREALAAHLRAFRGLEVDPAQIVVGSGAQTLYTFIVQLVGRHVHFAVEDPGYPRLTSIYRANDVVLSHVPLDAAGINVAALRASGAQVAHLMPSHQYPTGLVTPVSRRYELLGWAAEEPGRYLIEDDYDCEFRLAGRPIPAMKSIDATDRVIYVNTFARSLGPSFRIGYAVLPAHLAERFACDLGFYSCTVSTVEQLALARFIENGDFERHVNRMRVHYRAVKDALVEALAASPAGDKMTVEGADAGLHFLLRVNVPATEAQLVAAARKEGVALAPLSAFYQRPSEGDNNAFTPRNAQAPSFVVSYAGLARDAISTAAEALSRAVEQVSL